MRLGVNPSLLNIHPQLRNSPSHSVILAPDSESNPSYFVIPDPSLPPRNRGESIPRSGVPFHVGATGGSPGGWFPLTPSTPGLMIE